MNLRRCFTDMRLVITRGDGSRYRSGGIWGFLGFVLLFPVMLFALLAIAVIIVAAIPGVIVSWPGLKRTL